MNNDKEYKDLFEQLLYLSSTMDIIKKKMCLKKRKKMDNSSYGRESNKKIII